MSESQQWILNRYILVIRQHIELNDAILGLKQLDYLTDDEFESLQKREARLRIGSVLVTIFKKGTPEQVFHTFLKSLKDYEGQLEMGHFHLHAFLMDKYQHLKTLKQRCKMSGDPTLATQAEYDFVERESGSRPSTPPKSPVKGVETFESIKEDFLKWLKETFRGEMDQNGFLSTLKVEICATIKECFRTFASSMGLSGKAVKVGTKEEPSDPPSPCKSHGSVSSNHITLEFKERQKKIGQRRELIKKQQGHDNSMQGLGKKSNASYSQPTGDTFEDSSEDATRRKIRSYCMQSFSVTSAEMLDEILGGDLVLSASQCQEGHKLWEDKTSSVNVGHFGEHQVAIKTRRSGPCELSVKEAFILSQLQSSPNIVPLVGVLWIEGPTTVKLVTECPSTLDSYLLNVSTTDTRRLETIALHLCQGLAKLKEFGHGRTVVHNDVSRHSCFIRGDVKSSVMTAALGGFTFAEIAKDDGSCTALQVQPAYQQDYDRVNHSSHESDIRAFAIVVHSLYAGPSSVAAQGAYPPRPPSMPERLHAVLQECYQPNPPSRPSAVDLLIRLRALQELNT